jgi:hypothetical protein
VPFKCDLHRYSGGGIEPEGPFRLEVASITAGALYNLKTNCPHPKNAQGGGFLF